MALFGFGMLCGLSAGVVVMALCMAASDRLLK